MTKTYTLMRARQRDRRRFLRGASPPPARAVLAGCDKLSNNESVVDTLKSAQYAEPRGAARWSRRGRRWPRSSRQADVAAELPRQRHAQPDGRRLPGAARTPASPTTS